MKYKVVYSDDTFSEYEAESEQEARDKAYDEAGEEPISVMVVESKKETPVKQMLPAANVTTRDVFRSFVGTKQPISDELKFAIDKANKRDAHSFERWYQSISPTDRDALASEVEKLGGVPLESAVTRKLTEIDGSVKETPLIEAVLPSSKDVGGGDYEINPMGVIPDVLSLPGRAIVAGVRTALPGLSEASFKDLMADYGGAVQSNPVIALAADPTLPLTGVAGGIAKRAALNLGKKGLAGKLAAGASEAATSGGITAMDYASEGKDALVPAAVVGGFSGLAAGLAPTLATGYKRQRNLSDLAKGGGLEEDVGLKEKAISSFETLYKPSMTLRKSPSVKQFLQDPKRIENEIAIAATTNQDLTSSIAKRMENAKYQLEIAKGKIGEEAKVNFPTEGGYGQYVENKLKNKIDNLDISAGRKAKLYNDIKNNPEYKDLWTVGHGVNPEMFGETANISTVPIRTMDSFEQLTRDAAKELGSYNKVSLDISDKALAAKMLHDAVRETKMDALEGAISGGLKNKNNQPFLFDPNYGKEMTTYDAIQNWQMTPEAQGMKDALGQFKEVVTPYSIVEDAFHRMANREPIGLYQRMAQGDGGLMREGGNIINTVLNPTRFPDEALTPWAVTTPETIVKQYQAATKPVLPTLNDVRGGAVRALPLPIGTKGVTTGQRVWQMVAPTVSEPLGIFGEEN